MKVLFHTNAPWSPSGYGQQVALFAPRLAEYADLAISAFHGLANSPLHFGDLRDLPRQRRRLGQRDRRPHARHHFGRVRGGLVLSLVDVFVLEPAASGAS